MVLNMLALRHILVPQFMILSKGDAVANDFFKNYVRGFVLNSCPPALGL